MRGLIALFLAAILAAVAYAGFWWFSLAFNSAEMKGSVEQTLGGKLSFGNPEWMPELMAVHVRWPEVRMLLPEGPVREVYAGQLVMVSGFLTSDRWRLQLPGEVYLLMASGNNLVLQTKGGEIVLLDEPARLAFKADEVTVLNSERQVLAHINEVMIERRPGDEGGVRLNLASRPDWEGGSAVLSGQLVLPQPVVNALMGVIGRDGVPRFGVLMQMLARQLQKSGGMATLDNISFRQGEMSGAFYGEVGVAPNGDFVGELSVTAESLPRLMGWIERAGLVNVRSVPEKMGWRDFQGRIDASHPAMRMETMPNGLLLNGAPVGPIPKVGAVLERLWP